MIQKIVFNSESKTSKPLLFLPIIKESGESFKDKKHMKKMMALVNGHPDFELIKLMDERLGQERMTYTNYGLSIPYGLKQNIKILELFNFIRLISIIFQTGQDVEVSLCTPGVAQSIDEGLPLEMLKTADARIKDGISEQINGSVMLTEFGLQVSKIVITGNSKYENLIGDWGSSGKEWIDRQGFGFRYVSRGSYEFNHHALEQDIKCAMISELRTAFCGEHVSWSRESLEWAKNAYDCIANSAQKHMLEHENFNQKKLIKTMVCAL